MQPQMAWSCLKNQEYNNKGFSICKNDIDKDRELVTTTTGGKVRAHWLRPCDTDRCSRHALMQEATFSKVTSGLGTAEKDQ